MPTSTQIQKRALICFWEGYLGVAPSVINAIRYLAENGYQVDVVIRDAGTAFPDPPDMPVNASVIKLLAPSAKLNWLPSVPSIFGKLIRLLFLALDAWHFTTATAHLVKGRDYDLAFGIDMFGLIAVKKASNTATLRRVANWSLEMYFIKEMRNPVLLWAKMREIHISRKAHMIVIPDIGRGKLLAKENGFDESRIACVPNGPIGRPKLVNHKFLQQRLSLSSSTRLILHAGMISEGLLSLDLAQAAASWPDPYRLIFHERLSRSPEDPYLQEVLRAGAQRVSLSLEPVSYDQLDSVYASAWVGLVFYNDMMGQNFTQCAAASGKLAFYLRNCVPVVVCAQPDLKQLMDEYGCGIAINHPSGLLNAFKIIEADYDGFRKRALKCFDSRFDFRPAFESALGRLTTMKATPF